MSNLRQARGSGVGLTIGLLMAVAILMGVISMLISYQIQQNLVAVYRHIEQLDNTLGTIQQSLAIVGEDSDYSKEQFGTKLDQLFSEIDKLWASAWRRNQKEIKTLNDKLQQYTQSHTNEHLEGTKSLSRTITDINSLLATEGLTDVIKRVRDLDFLIKQLATDKELIDGRLKSNEVLVESINEWRRDFNQRFLHLRSSVDNLNKTPQNAPALQETPL